MSNNDISVQVGAAEAYTLQHPDGSTVTAQEAYDAFMSGQVMLHDSNGKYYIPLNFFWCDASANQNDPTNVVYFTIQYFINSSSTRAVEIGTYPS